MAEDRAFVLYDWMAGYGAEPTPERPCDDACERPLLADQRPTTRRGDRLGCGSHAKGITPPQADSCTQSADARFQTEGRGHSRWTKVVVDNVRTRAAAIEVGRVEIVS